MPVSKIRRFLRSSDLLQTAALLPSASVPHFVALCVTILATAAAPTGIIVLTGSLLRSFREAIQTGIGGSALGSVLAYGGGVVALYCAQQLLAPISHTLTTGLGNRLTLLWRELVSRRLYGLGAGLILASYNVWMAIALWASWSLIPGWIAANTRAQMRRVESLSPLLRRADYYRDLGLRQRPAKEVRIYGLSRWLVDEFTRHRSEGMASVSGEGGLARLAFIPYLAVPAALSAFVIWSLVQAALAGSMDVARLTVLVLAVVGTKEFSRRRQRFARRRVFPAAASPLRESVFPILAHRCLYSRVWIWIYQAAGRLPSSV
jgi:hypothetical protein